MLFREIKLYVLPHSQMEVCIAFSFLVSLNEMSQRQMGCKQACTKNKDRRPPDHIFKRNTCLVILVCPLELAALF